MQTPCFKQLLHVIVSCMTYSRRQANHAGLVTARIVPSPRLRFLFEMIINNVLMLSSGIIHILLMPNINTNWKANIIKEVIHKK